MLTPSRSNGKIIASKTVTADPPCAFPHLSSSTALRSTCYRIGSTASAIMVCSPACNEKLILQRLGTYSALKTANKMNILRGGENGLQFARKVNQTHPDLPVALMSGYPDTIAADKQLNEQGFPLLNKPFQRVELASALRSLLDLRTDVRLRTWVVSATCFLHERKPAKALCRLRCLDLLWARSGSVGLQELPIFVARECPLRRSLHETLRTHRRAAFRPFC